MGRWTRLLAPGLVDFTGVHDGDAVLALNFVPDRERAVKEMTRVTKPGGIVSAAVWDYGDGMAMLRVFWDEAIKFDPATASRDEAHMPLSKRGELGYARGSAIAHSRCTRARGQ